MAASLRVVAAAVCIVVILSSTAQLAVAQTVPDACNDQDCANACQAEANTQCSGISVGYPPVNAEFCNDCVNHVNNDCIPQCEAVCNSN